MPVVSDLWISISRPLRLATVIDEDDLFLLDEWRYLSLNETPQGKRYVLAQRGSKSCRERSYLHRILVGLERGDPLTCDHIDGDGLICGASQDNSGCSALELRSEDLNGGCGSSIPQSEYRGVSWDKKSEKWRAIVGVDGRNRYLGLFDDEARAAEIAAEYRREHLPFALS